MKKILTHWNVLACYFEVTTEIVLTIVYKRNTLPDTTMRIPRYDDGRLGFDQYTVNFLKSTRKLNNCIRRDSTEYETAFHQ